uniref:Uncharacterized protein n=1 Tax=uncultured bacterium Contig17 TaxID=1393492 RepID=W0FHW0_9BACT|nr:hypothetical protein [uncultured bacterium Contig17]
MERLRKKKTEAASGNDQKKEEKKMTLQEFKTKAENNEELKLALKEAMEKGDEAVAEFLNEQGVELASRVELSEDDLDAVVGGIGKRLKKAFKTVKHIVTPTNEEMQVIKDLANQVARETNQVVHDVFYK